MVEERCHTFLLYLDDHVETVDREGEVDGKREVENDHEGLEDIQGIWAGNLHLGNKGYTKKENNKTNQEEYEACGG